MGMTFSGSAELDLRDMLEILPREFTTEQAMEATGWELKKVRQAIVMGLGQDRLIPRDKYKNYKVYENVAWRKEWITKRWAA